MGDGMVGDMCQEVGKDLEKFKDILRDQIKCDGGGDDSSSEPVTEIFLGRSHSRHGNESVAGAINVI